MQYSYQSWGETWPLGQDERRMTETRQADDLQALESNFVQESLEAYLQTMQRPLQTQLDHLWRVAETHFQDNRALAEQIQQLLGEREQLLAALHAYELELSRYRPLFGNVHLKH